MSTFKLDERSVFDYSPSVIVEIPMPGDSRGGPHDPSPAELQVYDESRQLLDSLTDCRYCRTPLVSGRSGQGTGMYSNSWASYVTRLCPRCGWWMHGEKSGGIVGSFDPEDDLADVDPITFWLLEGVLREFHADALDLPVEVLRREVHRRPDIMLGVHPRKFEELAASLLSDFFDCEVELTARSRDGGVDLYAIHSSETLLIQVKRRSKPDATESVSTVRELAGVLLATGQMAGLVLSTADHFSQDAQDFAEAVSARGRHLIRLIDYGGLLRVLDVVRPRSLELPWQELQHTPLWNSRYSHLLNESPCLAPGQITRWPWQP